MVHLLTVEQTKVQVKRLNKILDKLEKFVKKYEYFDDMYVALQAYSNGPDIAMFILMEEILDNSRMLFSAGALLVEGQYTDEDDHDNDSEKSYEENDPYEADDESSDDEEETAPTEEETAKRTTFILNVYVYKQQRKHYHVLCKIRWLQNGCLYVLHSISSFVPSSNRTPYLYYVDERKRILFNMAYCSVNFDQHMLAELEQDFRSNKRCLDAILMARDLAIEEAGIQHMASARTVISPGA